MTLIKYLSDIGATLFLLAGSAQLPKRRMVELLANLLISEGFARVNVHTTNPDREGDSGFIVVSTEKFEVMKNEGMFIEFNQKSPEKGAHWYGLSLEEIKKASVKGHPFALVTAEAIIALKFQSPNIQALYLKAKKEEEDPQASNRFDEVITLPNREGSGIELIAQKMMSLAGKTTRA